MASPVGMRTNSLSLNSEEKGNDDNSILVRPQEGISRGNIQSVELGSKQEVSQRTER